MLTALRIAAIVGVLAGQTACSDTTEPGQPKTLAGRIVFSSTASGPARLFSARADGSNANILPGNLAGEFITPDVSPDGVHIVFASRGEIYVMHFITGETSLLASHPAFDRKPVWSPDGSVILFDSDRSGSSDLYTVRPDGTDLRQLTATPENESDGAWSPDGARIAFNTPGNGRSELAIMNSDGTGMNVLPTELGGGHPTWSSDGTQIAFVAPPFGGLRIINADGTNETALLPDASNIRRPAWSPDGKSIVFVANNQGSGDILSVTVDDAEVTSLFATPATEADPAWGPLK